MVYISWIAIYLLVCCIADSVNEINPWIQIEGCYNIATSATTSARHFNMTSQARPSECFGLCNNSSSVALQGKMCYCDPSYDDKGTRIQNFQRDDNCQDVCPGSPKVFCGGGQSAMSVYKNGTSVLLKLGINASEHGCVYVQMNGSLLIPGYVDQFCNQTHGVVCYEHCGNSCFKSAANLTWAEALRYCSKCSGNILSILAPSDRVRSCADLSSTSHCNLNSDRCSPPSAGTFSYWIGLYKDKAKDDSSTNVLSTQSSGSPITSSGSKTNAVDVTDDSSTNVLSTLSSGSPITSSISKTNDVDVTDDSMTNVPSTPSSGSKTNVGAIICGCVGGIAVVGGAAVVIYLYQKRRSRRSTNVIHVVPCEDPERPNVPTDRIPDANDLDNSIHRDARLAFG